MPPDELGGFIVYKVRLILVNCLLPYSSIQPPNRILARPTNTLKHRVLPAGVSLQEVDTFDTLEDVYSFGLPKDIIHFVVGRSGMQFCSFYLFLCCLTGP